MKYLKLLICALVFIPTIAFGQYQKIENGVKTTVRGMDVKIVFYSPDIVRVVKTFEGKEPAFNSYVVVMDPQNTNYSISSNNDVVEMRSSAMIVKLDTKSGKVSFSDLKGDNLLTEKEFGTQFSPVKYMQRPSFGQRPQPGVQPTGPSVIESYEVRQAFLLDEDEVIYGLGQHQSGTMNQRTQRLTLQQDNMLISIPYFASVKGYGLYWDNYSVTTFNDNPWECSLTSESGDCADYYFLYGQGGDNTLALLRQLTGAAKMNPLWTYGFWQCKERYKSQDELVSVVKKYRELGVPLDGIVQDWKYWGLTDGFWNSVEFLNPEFPDPKAMIDQVHDMNAKLMISVWPVFGDSTNIYRELDDIKAIIPIRSASNARAYDVYNSKANDILWKYMNNNMYSLGMDAWWMDGSEPEFYNYTQGDFNFMTALGRPLRDVRNVYPLFTNKAIYERQLQTDKSKRLFLLTRSSFAGMQRYGAGSWSGDIRASWKVFRDQISGGLNFSICGIPYWNTDIGAWHPFGNVYNTANTDPAYQQFYVRWFQFATFTPMLRSHGSGSPREIFQFGDRGYWAFDVQEQYINLRYAMMPYLYSTAWQITNKGYTYMRQLYMEAPKDKKVYDMDDEYMFGSAFLVAPVLEEDAKTRNVYLPNSSGWYDYWTNEYFEGGQTVAKEVPIEIMPLYVKEGSIVPFNADKLQYADEKPWSKIEVKVYPGANAQFVLYEDENDSYNYENGVYTEIPMVWNDANKTLTIEARKGSFDGMLKSRKFIVNVAGQSKSKTVTYTGKELIVKF